MTHHEIAQLIRELLEKSGFACDDVEMKEDQLMETVVLNIRTPDARHLIGRDGDVVRAFNHVVRAMVEQALGEARGTVKFSIDVDDYFAKRLQGLKNKARVVADRARSFKTSVELEPMTSYERLVIHQYLAEAPDIATESTGEGRDRRIVVKYAMTAE